MDWVSLIALTWLVTLFAWAWVMLNGVPKWKRGMTEAEVRAKLYPPTPRVMATGTPTVFEFDEVDRVPKVPWTKAEKEWYCAKWNCSEHYLDDLIRHGLVSKPDGIDLILDEMDAESRSSHLVSDVIRGL